jgi:hypothetical protein
MLLLVMLLLLQQLPGRLQLLQRLLCCIQLQLPGLQHAPAPYTDALGVVRLAGTDISVSSGVSCITVVNRRSVH